MEFKFLTYFSLNPLCLYLNSFHIAFSHRFSHRFWLYISKPHFGPKYSFSTFRKGSCLLPRAGGLLFLGHFSASRDSPYPMGCGCGGKVGEGLNPTQLGPLWALQLPPPHCLLIPHFLIGATPWGNPNKLPAWKSVSKSISREHNLQFTPSAFYFNLTQTLVLFSPSFDVVRMPFLDSSSP